MVVHTPAPVIADQSLHSGRETESPAQLPGWDTQNLEFES